MTTLHPGPDLRRGRRVKRGALHAALALLLFLAACVSYFARIDESGFHPDESRWLNRAHYAADVLDPFGPTWNDQYLTRGQPPIGSYVMGIGLLLQGRDLDTNPAWDFRRSKNFNTVNGMVPVEADLLAGRRTNAFLGALTVVVVFLIGCRLANALGGLVAASLLIVHPLVRWHNSVALADTTLLLTLALLLYVAMRLADRPGWGWAVTLGILVGIGGANKLTPLALLGPLVLIGALLLGRDWWARRRLRRATAADLSLLPGLNHIGWMLLSTPVIAGVTFVAVYPYLWQQPFWRTVRLFEFRRQENDGQGVLFPQFQVDGPLDAVRRTVNMLGELWSSTEQILLWLSLDAIAGPLSRLDLALAFAGGIALVVYALRSGLQSRYTLVLALTVTQVAAIIFSMRADFERYYLPIVLGSVIVAGFGVGIGGARAATIGRRLRRLRARPAPALAGSPGGASAQPR